MQKNLKLGELEKSAKKKEKRKGKKMEKKSKNVQKQCKKICEKNRGNVKNSPVEGKKECGREHCTNENQGSHSFSLSQHIQCKTEKNTEKMATFCKNGEWEKG